MINCVWSLSFDTITFFRPYFWTRYRLVVNYNMTNDTSLGAKCTRTDVRYVWPENGAAAVSEPGGTGNNDDPSKCRTTRTLGGRRTNNTRALVTRLCRARVAAEQANPQRVRVLFSGRTAKYDRTRQGYRSDNVADPSARFRRGRTVGRSFAFRESNSTRLFFVRVSLSIGLKPDSSKRRTCRFQFQCSIVRWYHRVRPLHRQSVLLLSNYYDRSSYEFKTYKLHNNNNNNQQLFYPSQFWRCRASTKRVSSQRPISRHTSVWYRNENVRTWCENKTRPSSQQTFGHHVAHLPKKCIHPRDSVYILFFLVVFILFSPFR